MIYLVYATIKEGEHEHSAHGMLEAKNNTEAWAKAAKLLHEYFDYDDWTIVKLNDVKPIQPDTAQLLEDLNLVHFMEGE